MRFRLRNKPRQCSLHYARIKGVKIAVKPGDIIECEPTELGNWIAMYEQLDPDPPEPPAASILKIVHRGFGRYDVVNQCTGITMNSRALSKPEAEALVNENDAAEIGDVEHAGQNPATDMDNPANLGS
jgi:hypothetical protein